MKPIWRRKKKKEPETILGSRDWPATYDQGPMKSVRELTDGEKALVSAAMNEAYEAITITDVSSTSTTWFVRADAFGSPPNAWDDPTPRVVSDEYQEFLRWKQKREEEKKEEPPKLVRPMRLIEL